MAANHSDNHHHDPASTAADRRDFFRITDQVGLEIRRLPPEEPPAAPFNDTHLEALRAEYRRLDQDVRSQLATLAERDRLLTSLIKSINGKLDTLARIMTFEQNPLQPEDWREVTLSEGGLSFTTTTDDYSLDEELALRLTLPPELFQPMATARILFIDTDGNTGEYRVHTEFVDIHDQDRQQIARHVLRWQIRQRQNR
ncbi:PilZ domain-containing protein [Marinobacter confluentis]|uniref:PilZ domain-containing protein n=1 Tax=Marinobacter confluentis TaxID=1697557 RepID=A0A4Z1C4W9_9GAMM|nr:PilZ domain-containing protein [Marinobacter confluentis]TGN41441.1 PilZ domain-containing protein [Marinobacter confluentis]